ncbi:MAG: SMI1/KNR4 family protein [Ruminococcus sp.]|uniref:SMI1/KNR4 family protein n=1 Tax=Ruminococcus sp. TaxID=41978 RepID=UPI0025F94362|nr:SMI1/KNR4 family protein [Ruminococcus sp.]MBR5681654.1 SMI1/KNR4 family protein [Ruminococcus sp.]
MTYQTYDILIARLKAAYEALGCHVEFEKAPPASEAELAIAEARINQKIPTSLRSFFAAYSGNVRFYAKFPQALSFAAPFSEIFSAEFHFSLDLLYDFRQNIAPGELDPENDYDRPFFTSLLFADIPNGDSLAFDYWDSSDDPRVIYLSHDGDEDENGTVLGKSFRDYFERMLLTAAVGSEIWQQQIFLPDKESGLDPNCNTAREYRALIRLQTDDLID